MKLWLSDPVVLSCSGIIIVGVIALFWAIGKFKRLVASGIKAAPTDDLFTPGPDLREIDFKAPSPRTPAGSSSPGAISKDVSERLDSMSQRLAEMQSVLTKQSSAPGAAPGAGVGQGFSPETIDKLLKIIGNVIQQVDILQKSVGPTKEEPKV